MVKLILQSKLERELCIRKTLEGHISIENIPIKLLIKRENSFDDGIREELEIPDFIINNNGDLTNLYQQFLKIIK